MPVCIFLFRTVTGTLCLLLGPGYNKADGSVKNFSKPIESSQLAFDDINLSCTKGKAFQLPSAYIIDPRIFTFHTDA